MIIKFEGKNFQDVGSFADYVWNTHKMELFDEPESQEEMDRCINELLEHLELTS